MKHSCEELWNKALGGPIKVVVNNHAGAISLRHQLYRWRAKLQKANRAISGAPVSEFDHLSIAIRAQDNGQWALELASGTIDILSVEDLGG